jgi:uncharacterized membrane protein YfcA
MKRPQVTVRWSGIIVFALACIFVFLEEGARSLTPVSAALLRVIAGLCVAAAGIWIVASRRATTRQVAESYERAPESARRFYGSPFWIRRFKSYESFTESKFMVGGILMFLVGIAFTAIAVRDFIHAVR